MKLFKLLPFAALAFTGIAAAVTPARYNLTAPSIVVKYDTKSLATTAGAKQLHLRLRAAAQSVCEPLNSRILGLREEYDHCVRGAISRGVADINNPNLTSFHRKGSFARVAAN